ncbi:hypothetical protein AC58_3289 [Escherichia coli 3-105-05_S3_C3]|nr:hypothetical protein AC58_3289 [Escherichia coli 3-105-05_S3_C3]
MALTRSYYVSMKFAFLNMSSGYVYRIDTFQPYVDKALFLNMLPEYAYGIDTFLLCVDEIRFFKHVFWICLPHRHIPAICR